MKKMKGSSNYLKNQVTKNLLKAILCFLLFGLIFVGLGLKALFTFSLNIFEVVGLLVSLIPLVVFYFYLRKYRIYNGGWQGEKQVVKELSKKLSDDYILLNDLYLQNVEGDIDQVVLAPTGIFVLETKNWSGDIVCNGDEWQRTVRHSLRGSPSRQVKRNVAMIKRIINSSQISSILNIRVEGILVFTNNYARLHLSNPTVLVLKLSQLSNYIATSKSSGHYSYEQLEIVGKEILKQKR